MAANIDPIYSREGDVTNNGTTGMNAAITAAANDYTGTGANNTLIFTSNSTNGSFVQRIRLKPTGTNGASVMRFFINNGSDNTVAANNVFYGEISLPATTGSAVAALVELDYPMNFALPPGFRIYMGLGSLASGGWVACVIAGKY